MVYGCLDIVHRPPREIVVPDPVMVGLKNDGIALNYLH